MNRSCIPPEDIGRVSGLPADSPERLHAESCPRCLSLMQSYRELLEDRSVPSGADVGGAGAHLRAAFRQAAGMSAAPSRRSGAGALVGARMTVSGLRGRVLDFTRRLLRPSVLATATAAVLLMVGVYAGYERFRAGAGPDRLRGAETGQRAGGAPITLIEPRPRETGAVELSWRSVPGVASYEVVIMRGDLADLTRLGTGRDTTCVVRWADFHPAPSPGALLGWQVLGLRNGAAAARSPIGTLRVP